LSTLTDNKILSAPVVDASGTIHKSVDMLDLVAYAVVKLDLLKETIKKDHETQVNEFLHKEIRNLPDFSNRNPFYTISSRKSLKKAIHLLSHPHFHRVWVEEDGVLVGVLTQSRAIEILLDHHKELKGTMKMRLFEAFPEARQTLMINHKELLINAFAKINLDRVSGIAVVDDDGVLVGNISASDLKFAKFSNPKDLLLELTHPIEEFLTPPKEGLLSWFFGSGRKGRLFEPIVVKPGDTLQEVMEKCATNKIHRVYVVDNSGRPLYVVSLGDIIAQFQYFPVHGGPLRG